MMSYFRPTISRAEGSGGSGIFAILGLLAMFLISSDILNILNWPYNSASSSILLKIHPAVYLLMFSSFGYLITINNKAGIGWGVDRPPFVFYSLVAVLTTLVAFFGARFRGDLGGGETSAAIVTFVGPIFLLFSMSRFSDLEKAKIGSAIRIFFVLNSVIALAENIFDWRLVPTAFVIDQWRATALLGHPLANATLTGTVLIYLAIEEVERWKFSRTLEILLHGAALLCFGGRAVSILVPLVIGLRVLSVSINPSRLQYRATLGRYWAGGFATLAALAASIPLAITQTFFDRFQDDRGSGATRFAALRILSNVDANGLLFGLSGTERRYAQALNNTSFGIEVAWIALILTYGIVIAAIVFFAIVWLSNSIRHKTSASGGYIMLYFIASTFASLSIGSKTLIISQIFAITLCLCSTARASGPSAKVEAK